MLDFFETIMDRMDDAYLRDEQSRQNERQARDARDAKRTAGAGRHRIR